MVPSRGGTVAAEGGARRGGTAAAEGFIGWKGALCGGIIGWNGALVWYNWMNGSAQFDAW